MITLRRKLVSLLVASAEIAIAIEIMKWKHTIENKPCPTPTVGADLEFNMCNMFACSICGIIFGV